MEHSHKPVDITEMPVPACPRCEHLTAIGDTAGKKAAREIRAARAEQNTSTSTDTDSQ